MAHTPGPWQVDAEYRSEVLDADGETIASCWHEECADRKVILTRVLKCSLVESAANARLIAAAPDMLVALRQMVVNSETDGKSYRDCHKKSVAAIAKATEAA